MVNSKSRILKIGKWWTLMVRYIIPIVLIVIWFGGLYEIIITETTEHLIILISLTLFSLIMSLIFTKLPARTDSWLKVDERIVE